MKLSRKCKIRLDGYKSIVVPSDYKSTVENAIDCRINTSVEPEIIYQHKNQSDLLLLECKVNGFKVDLTNRNTKQAMGYLCCSESHVQEYLGFPPYEQANTKLLYAVSSADVELQKETLNKLSFLIEEAQVPCLNFSVVGIEVKENEVYLTTLDNGKKEKIRIIKGSHPHLLNIVPVDPSSSGRIADEQKENLKVLEQRVLTALRAALGKNLGYKEFEISTHDICERAIPIWRLWNKQSQKQLQPFIRKYISQAFARLKKKGLMYKFDAHQQLYKVSDTDHQTANKVRNYLASKEFVKLGNDIFDDIQLSFDDFDDFDDLLENISQKII
ncbi:hypothetical protein [Bacillus sp. 123MFChir2]|uniref:hypothetical protein n=1 Tax=Bacillus sp. 123MFChir2 TaxID=1169144 RepID=UPI000371AE4A|nr:hypothetical protein [Bacillus sp. 123MFChir2]